MHALEIFDQLWMEYSKRTPSAEKIKTLFESTGNSVYNDHVAFRTFDDSRINIDILAEAFKNLGYVEKGEYHFEAKKLYAKHFEHPTNEELPKVFISELILAKCSEGLQATVKHVLAQLDESVLNDSELLTKGRLWGKPSYTTYQALLEESEYAAWLYVNGFCSNHFTVDVNKLDSFKSLQEVNTFLKENSYKLNASGGEIKGSPEQLLEQSSILADKISIEFQEGAKEITSCYYEFAFRHAKENGELFTGFIAGSADKIFESTDMRN